MSQFKTIHDLSTLDEGQRKAYLNAVSAHFGLDPEANLFDMIWMNKEDGMRKLLVYARRGTTDILREKHGISVTSMNRINGPSDVTFVVSGKNKNGREEFSSGTASIEGLKGERLSSAIMTAQTRALRRLTLQFVGGGILDVAEVDEKTSDINNSPASLAQLSGSSMPPVFAPPVTTPNMAPGKIVEPTREEILKQKRAENPGASIFYPEHVSVAVPVEAQATIGDPKATPEQLKEAFAKDIVTPDPAHAPIEEPKTERKPRGRKRRNTVDLSSPGQEPATTPVEPPKQMEIPTGSIDAQGKITSIELPKPIVFDSEPIKFVPTDEATQNQIKAIMLTGTPKQQAEVLASISAPKPPETISPEKLKGYRERLTKYISDILPREGKMMPSEGIGGTPNKLRKFAQIFNNVDDVKKMTEEQWEQLLGFLDDYYKTKGAVELTNYINASIGATA